MGEEVKHSYNDEACALRGWSCIALVVEVLDGWGNEAINMFSSLCKKVAPSCAERGMKIWYTCTCTVASVLVS